MRLPTPYYDEWDDLYGLVRDILVACAAGFFLYVAHRIATGVLLGARIEALREYGEAYAPEEREVLIHKIKQGSMS